MTKYEKFKNMSIDEIAKFLANEAFMIWRAQQSIEVLRKLTATQIRAVSQSYYYYYYEILRKEVQE